MAKNEFQSEALRRLIAIDNKTESMDDSLAWLVRAVSPQLQKELINAFGKSKRRIEVYLALDGKRNVDEHAKYLNMISNNVSRELRWLKDRGLVDTVEAGGDGVIYKKKKFDSIVGLSEALAEKFKISLPGNN